MKAFMDKDFLLDTDTARELFHETACQLPVIDFHNHLNPREIYENKCYQNLTEAWLQSDHYKWRAMRANGIPEELITGNADPYEKFLAWADTVQNCIGNPLYHWTHMELQRYFNITTPLSPDTAEEIWNQCNALLHTPQYSVQNLLGMQNAEILCTTDDPADDLNWHEKLAEHQKEIGFSVLPTFRPGKALEIESEHFQDYIHLLSEISGTDTSTFSGLLEALEKRLDYFISHGCRVTDHSLETDFYIPASEFQINTIYQKVLSGQAPTAEEAAMYKGYLLTKLGIFYSDRSLVMQLHIGAIRNNSSRIYHKSGPDMGCDSQNDFNYAAQLSGLLDAMDRVNRLPRTILYYLNPKDAAMLATMAGNYQGNDSRIRGKVQLGSAWWFCDHKNGMKYQMDTLADVGLLSAFVGMLTDSRSFLSFPRHEYFRRILCSKIGAWVENGEYPYDRTYLHQLVRNICHDNAAHYFGFDKQFCK